MKKYNYNLMESEAEKRLQKNKITLSIYRDILSCLLDIFTSKSGTAETIIKTTTDFFRRIRRKNNAVWYWLQNRILKKGLTEG